MLKSSSSESVMIRRVENTQNNNHDTRRCYGLGEMKRMNNVEEVLRGLVNE